MLSERLLEPGQTCMDPDTHSEHSGRNATHGNVFSVDVLLRVARVSANVVFTEAL